MSAARLSARVAAATACRRAWDGRAFAWGRADCVHLARWILRAQGRAVPMLKLGGYRTEAGAVRALRRTGFASLAEAFGAAMRAQGVETIPAASTLPGDVVAMVGAEPWGASLCVALGQGWLLGVVGDRFTVFQPAARADAFVGAWRIDPWRP